MPISYQQMLDECARVGHDMTEAKAVYAKRLATKAAPAAIGSRVSPQQILSMAVNAVGPVIKEQQQLIAKLEAETAELKTRMDALEARQAPKNIRRVV